MGHLGRIALAGGGTGVDDAVLCSLVAVSVRTYSLGLLFQAISALNCPQKPPAARSAICIKRRATAVMASFVTLVFAPFYGKGPKEGKNPSCGDAVARKAYRGNGSAEPGAQTPNPSVKVGHRLVAICPEHSQRR